MFGLLCVIVSASFESELRLPLSDHQAVQIVVPSVQLLATTDLLEGFHERYCQRTSTVSQHSVWTIAIS